MSRYIITFLHGITMIGIAYFSGYLFMNARQSRLYNTVSAFGIVGTLIALFNIVNIFVDFSQLLIYRSLLLSLLSIILYFIWQTNYNQINKNHYSIFMVILAVLSVIIKICVNKEIVDLPILKTMTDFEFLNILSLGLTTLLFIKFTNQNKTHELNFIPFATIILMMSLIISLVSINMTAYIFDFMLSLSILFILFVFIKDYKNSFYY